GARQRAVEDVEQRADYEDGCTEPEVQKVVAILEVDDHGRGETERYPGGRELVRRHARLRERPDGTSREPSGAGGVAVLEPGERCAHAVRGAMRPRRTIR